MFEQITQVFRNGGDTHQCLLHTVFMALLHSSYCAFQEHFLLPAMGLSSHTQLQPNTPATQLLRAVPSIVQNKLCGKKFVINLR